jgi:hypothetical protein
MSRTVNVESKILIGLGIICLLAAAVVLAFTRTVIRYAAADDLYLLTRYDPNSEYFRSARLGYDDLYRWTNHLVRHRNHFGFQFFYTLAASLLITGVLLTAWATDRHRLKRMPHNSARPKDTTNGT